MYIIEMIYYLSNIAIQLMRKFHLLQMYKYILINYIVI